MDIYLPLRHLNVKSVLENPFFLFGFTSDIWQIITDRVGDGQLYLARGIHEGLETVDYCPKSKPEKCQLLCIHVPSSIVHRVSLFKSKREQNIFCHVEKSKKFKFTLDFTCTSQLLNSVVLPFLPYGGEVSVPNPSTEIE